MQEVYRSFDGVLGFEDRDGYIIYDIKDFYEIHFLSVYLDSKHNKFRVEKSALNNFEDIEKISELLVKVNDGCLPGQAYYKSKWYSQELINKLQLSHKDYEWKKYV